MPGLSFRPIAPNDMERSEVQSFVCGDDEWADEVAAVLRDGRALEHELSKTKQSTLLLCTTDPDEVVGFASVIVGKNVGFPDIEGARIRVFRILYIAVSSHHQGNKYFSKMMADLAATAIKLGHDAIDLYVHKDNARAIGLYEGLGFEWHPNAPMRPLENPRYRHMIRVL